MNDTTKSTSVDPKDHENHSIGIDHWARDFGGRHVPGNGYCFTCGCPVNVHVEPEQSGERTE